MQMAAHCAYAAQGLILPVGGGRALRRAAASRPIAQTVVTSGEDQGKDWFVLGLLHNRLHQLSQVGSELQEIMEADDASGVALAGYDNGYDIKVPRGKREGDDALLRMTLGKVVTTLVEMLKRPEHEGLLDDVLEKDARTQELRLKCSREELFFQVYKVVAKDIGRQVDDKR